MNGLSFLNIEVTRACNKKCYFCFREKSENDHMEWSLVEKIYNEIPPYLNIQLHKWGEPLLYPRLYDILKLFRKKNCFINIVTNGKLLVDRADEIIDNVDSLTVSIFDDNDHDQMDKLRSFLDMKGSRPPFVVIKFIDNINEEKYDEFIKLGCIITRRAIRKGCEFVYNGNNITPTIPEIGVCWDLLTRLVIDVDGNVSVCVRSEPLGNIKSSSLSDIWFSEKRLSIRELHISGKRSEVDSCKKCSYWGIPVWR